MTCELDTLAVYGIESGIRVRDPETMLSFYIDTIGFQPHAEIFIPDGHVWGLRFGNSMLKLMYRADAFPPEPEHRSACHYVTIHVLNAEEMAARCAAAGVTIVAPYSTFTPTRPGDPECGYVLITDPEGNRVEFSQGSPWVLPSPEFAARGATMKGSAR